MRVFLVALFVALSVSPSFAQVRGWVDVNFIAAKPREGEQTYAFTRTLFSEPASFATAYPEIGTAKGPEVAGGVGFGGSFGVGVRFVRVTGKYSPGMAVIIPHPTLFNRSASASAALDAELERKDLDVDIMVSYDLPTPDAVRVRLFGGPTYFSVNQQMVHEIRYRQAVLGTLNAVEITEGRYDDVKGSGWGANVGADVSYFFSRYVGVGGTVRFNTGSVTIDEPFTGEEADLKAGRTTFGAGLRLRF